MLNKAYVHAEQISCLLFRNSSFSLHVIVDKRIVQKVSTAEWNRLLSRLETEIQKKLLESGK